MFSSSGPRPPIASLIALILATVTSTLLAKANTEDLRRAEQQTGQPPADIVAEVATLQRQLARLGEQFDEYRAG